MYICICIKKYVYIYYCIWLYVYTHLHCPHVHRSSNILNWASQSGTYWTWNDSLASPAKAASVASDQASCQRTNDSTGHPLLRMIWWLMVDDILGVAKILWRFMVVFDFEKDHQSQTFRQTFISCPQTQQKVSTFPPKTCFASDPWSQFSLFVFVRNRFRPLILVV